MRAKTPKPAPHRSAADTTQAVDEFMRTLDHPAKAVIQAIRDPEDLLTWLAKDRAMIVFKDLQDFGGKQADFELVIRQWIRYV